MALLHLHVLQYYMLLLHVYAVPVVIAKTRAMRDLEGLFQHHADELFGTRVLVHHLRTVARKTKPSVAAVRDSTRRTTPCRFDWAP